MGLQFLPPCYNLDTLSQYLDTTTIKIVWFLSKHYLISKLLKGYQELCVQNQDLGACADRRLVDPMSADIHTSVYAKGAQCNQMCNRESESNRNSLLCAIIYCYICVGKQFNSLQFINYSFYQGGSEGMFLQYKLANVSQPDRATENLRHSS